jgi:hypothetical protein
MGQLEVLQFLKDARKKSEKYYTKNEIASGLKRSKISVNGLFDDLHRLSLFKMIELKLKGKPWNVKFLWRGKYQKK